MRGLSPAQRIALQEQSLVVLGRLAEGGVASVWLVGRQDEPEVRYALKTLRFPFDADDEIIGMFCDEIRMLRMLHHPHLAAYVAGSEDPDAPYLLMEYVRGCDLGVLLQETQRRGVRWPVEAAVWVGAQTLSALHYLHQPAASEGRRSAVVHRDLSPPNLIVSVEGHTKLVDLGIAVSEMILRQTAWDSLRGRWAYLSPEAVSGQPVEPRSDLFSWGLVMWEMLMGRRLFAGMSPERILACLPVLQMPPLVGVDAPWREALEPILARVLEPILAQRAESAEKVLVDLEPWSKQAQAGKVFLEKWATQIESERRMDSAVDGANREGLSCGECGGWSE